MKRIFFLAVVGGFAALISNSAQAQHHQNNQEFGYEFGVGVGQAYRPGYRPGRRFYPRFNNLPLRFQTFNPRLEEPPFFAKFPPVYYDQVIPRNYGASPFAAPAGIVPIEGLSPQPRRIQNEFYPVPGTPESNEPPMAEEKKTIKETSSKKIKDKSARVFNPYFTPRIARSTLEIR